MSSYLPPTQDLDKFNPIVFPDGDDTGITLGEADARYVKKSGSIMTGSLSAPSISITNTLTLEGEDVGTKLDQIDTNTSNISNNSTAITTLQTKTTDLTYDSGTDTSTFSGKLEATDDATFSNTLDAVVNIKSGPSLSNDAFLKFFHAGLYRGGMYCSTDGVIINSYKVGLNFPEIQFRFEDGVISNMVLEINDSNIVINEPLIPSINGLFELGSSSKFFSKLYSQDVETSNHSSIDTAITTNITNISNNSSNISTLQTKTQFQSASGSGGSSKTEFTNAQTIIKSNYTTYLLIKGDEDNSSSTEGAYLQFHTGQVYQGQLGSDRNSLILTSNSSGSVKPFYIKFIENGSITHTALEMNEINSIFNNNVIPNITSTNTLGSTLKYWNHAYINNISTSSFPDLNTTLGGISTNSTNISNLDTRLSTAESNISSNDTDILTLQLDLNITNSNVSSNSISINTNSQDILSLLTKTQDLSYNSGNYELATNLFEITAGNSGDCVLRLRSDQDNNNENDNCFIKFSQDGTSDRFSMGFQGGGNNNNLQFISYYVSFSSNDNFQFLVNTTETKLGIGDDIEAHTKFISHEIEPDVNATRALGSSSKFFTKLYSQDIETSNHASIDTDITDLTTKTQYLSVSGTDLIIDTEVVKHENNNSVYLVLNGDKNNTNSSLGSYLTLYAHNVFNGYLGTIGTFLDLHSFSAGTVKPIKFTFQDSAGTHTSLSCDDVDIKFNVNILPETNNTFSIGASGNIFSTSYFNNIITSSHNVNTAINTLNTQTQNISATSITTTIGGSGQFTNIVGQFDLPNNTNVDNLLTGFGIVLTSLTDKTTDMTYTAGETSFASQIRSTYNIDDTSIDWGLIDNGRGNVSGFKPSIHLDTSERSCYIGVITESGNTTAGVGIGYDGGGGDDPNMAIYFCSNSQAYFRSHINSGHAKPTIDNNYDLGASNRRWDDVYATNAIIQTSDQRQKNSIETLDETEMKEFISKLNPVKYKFNEKVRYHCGLISQEVKEEMPFDFGLYIHNEEADTYGLRYTELIAPMISTMQNLIKDNENLKKDNENLKSRLNTIEELLGIENNI